MDVQETSIIHLDDYYDPSQLEGSPLDDSMFDDVPAKDINKGDLHGLKFPSSKYDLNPLSPPLNSDELTLNLKTPAKKKKDPFAPSFITTRPPFACRWFHSTGPEAPATYQHIWTLKVEKTPIQELGLAKASLSHAHTTYPELTLTFLKSIEFNIPLLYCMQCKVYYIAFCQTSLNSKKTSDKWKSMLESLRYDKDLHKVISAQLTVEMKDCLGAYSL